MFLLLFSLSAVAVHLPCCLYRSRAGSYGWWLDGGQEGGGSGRGKDYRRYRWLEVLEVLDRYRPALPRLCALQKSLLCVGILVDGCEIRKGSRSRMALQLGVRAAQRLDAQVGGHRLPRARRVIRPCSFPSRPPPTISLSHTLRASERIALFLFPFLFHFLLILFFGTFRLITFYIVVAGSCRVSLSGVRRQDGTSHQQQQSDILASQRPSIPAPLKARPRGSSPGMIAPL